ncbi:MAG: hypothetical protein HPY44_16435 [Armatimonadetes bacterium]|nr:hypothetical protein [Armatimonadota bacterium]
MRTRHLPMLCLLLLMPVIATLAADTDGDGLADDLETELGLPLDAPVSLLQVATSPDAGLSDEEAGRSAPDVLTVEAGHAGDRRVLLKATFARPVDFAGSTFIFYVDVDGDTKTGRVDQYHGGTDVMVIFSDRMMQFTFYAPCDAGNTGARSAKAGNVLYVALDAPFRIDGESIPLGLHVLSQRKDSTFSDSTRHARVDLPKSGASVPVLPLGKGGVSRSASEFRFVNDKVAYEKLSDKGLRAEQVAPKEPIQFGRERPRVTYVSTPRGPAGPDVVARRRINVELLEEAGIARSPAAISFGIPLPQRALTDPANMRLLRDGQEVPCQFQATAFWPDGSLKWVIADARVPLGAKERADLVVEFGREVSQTDAAPKLSVEDNPDSLTVTTGPLKAVIDREQFCLISAAWFDRNGDGLFADDERVGATDPAGVVLRDEKGKEFRMSAAPPDDFRVEMLGPQKAVVRVEGSYGAEDGAKYMRYITRLTFRAGSPVVETAITHINDYLATEFTDITSLSFTYRPEGGADSGALFPEDGWEKPAQGRSISVFQKDETGERGSGALSWSSGGLRGSAVVHDFWQRWPKALSVRDGQVIFDLLPEQPGPEYGKDLPYWLMYPFVEGKYRFKWGMGMTERISLDLSGSVPVRELWAEAQVPVVAVIPAEWYAETRAFGPVAAPRGKQFAAWDEFVEKSFEAHLATKERQREYGYFNYGDWFGERGRNWGNNEYDLAHGLFSEFVRTGNRDLFRLARVSARHRADVDTVWAYPDPYYVGATHQHSIGHSGTWTEAVERATWSYRYDMHTSAEGGHVWAHGIVDSWFLTGEPQSMESAIALGEHIAYAFAPTFHALGTHERSAGWSLVAIGAIYQATYDPVYLQAARRIAEVALREQKMEKGGAWPHVLPRDHAGSEQGAEGNNLFLIGILLSGLQAYHEMSGDPAALHSLEAGVGWVLKSWDGKASGWPYSAKTDGTPLYRASTSLNQLIIGPIAYVGRLTGNDSMMQVVQEALSASAFQSPAANGKSLAQQLFFTGPVLAELQAWLARTREDKGLNVLDGSPESMTAMLIRTATSDRHSVRAPDKKVFGVRLREAGAELSVIRTPHGAMNRRAEFATVRVLDASGNTVHEGRCSTDDKYQVTWALPGQPGDEYAVLVDDDQRGVWSLRGDSLDIVMRTSPDFRIGGVGRSRYYFMVPESTPEFGINLVGVHVGPYAALVLDPDGKAAGSYQGANPGAALIPGAPPASGPVPPGNPERATITVKPAPEQTGKLWSVILSAAGDIGVHLTGVPGWLALSERDWFQPAVLD